MMFTLFNCTDPREYRTRNNPNVDSFYFCKQFGVGAKWSGRCTLATKWRKTLTIKSSTRNACVWIVVIRNKHEDDIKNNKDGYIYIYIRYIYTVYIYMVYIRYWSYKVIAFYLYRLSPKNFLLLIVNVFYDENIKNWLDWICRLFHSIN